MIIRRRPPRLKGLSLNHLLPNVLTVLALCSGLTAVRFAHLEQWQAAVAAIVVAAVLDGLDGRLARLLGGGSKFGAELDSLSDFLSFGAAPAVVVYTWSSHELGGIGWAAALFLAVCCALRLARFNTALEDPDKPAFAYNYFVGVPAPAGGGLALLPMMISFEWTAGPFREPVLTSLWLVVIGLLMVSRFPTFAFKKVKVPHAYVLPTLVGAGLFTAALFSAPWLTLIVLGVIYLAMFPLSYRSFRRLTKEAQRIAGVPSPEESPPKA
ncbi:MAG: phosphatidylcholine/phosphatidylserine synthase [Alphaproteobacteria bacterium]|nr:phosphatidylcholine/phosphatidylserine synthase [Alphaproteobacteria bacterium]